MTLEERLAKALSELENLVGAEGEFSTYKDLVNALKSEIDELKRADTTSILEEFDKLKSGQEQLVKQIRNSRKGFYVSGIEDQPFSVLKAVMGCRTGNWADAEHEKEMMDSWRDKAAHVAGDDVKGGNFIADQVIPDVIAGIYTKSAFIALNPEDGATRISVIEGLSGGTVRIPKFDGGMIAYWIGEEDPYVESMASVGDITMNPKKLGVLMRITDTMQKFQSYGFEQLLRRDMIKAAAKKLDWTVAYGTGGDNMPRGLANTEGIRIYNSNLDTSQLSLTDLASMDADWDGADISFDLIDNMLLHMEEDDIEFDESFAAISSKRLWKRLKQLKTHNFASPTADDPQPYMLGMPTLSDRKLAEALGIDFGWTNQIPTTNVPGQSIGAPETGGASKFTDLFIGNMGEAILGRWFGIEIVNDEGMGTGFSNDWIYTKLRMYADFNVRQKRAIMLASDIQCRD